VQPTSKPNKRREHTCIAQTATVAPTVASTAREVTESVVVDYFPQRYRYGEYGHGAKTFEEKIVCRLTKQVKAKVHATSNKPSQQSEGARANLMKFRAVIETAY